MIYYKNTKYAPIVYLLIDCKIIEYEKSNYTLQFTFRISPKSDKPIAYPRCKDRISPIYVSPNDDIGLFL